MRSCVAWRPRLSRSSSSAVSCARAPPILRSGSRSAPKSGTPFWRSSRRSISRRRPTPPAIELGWQHHVLNRRLHTAYVPFRMTLGALADATNRRRCHVRAVSRHDGLRATSEHSSCATGCCTRATSVPRQAGNGVVRLGEMPVGGPATSSGETTSRRPPPASAALALQQRATREAEGGGRRGEAARRKSRSAIRSLFPFEEYFFVESKSRGLPGRGDRARAGAAARRIRRLRRAHRSRAASRRAAAAIRTHGHRARSVGAAGDQQSDLRERRAGADGAARPQQQSEQPYAFGRSEILPRATPAFTTERCAVGGPVRCATTARPMPS